jgi:hypothetical protein
MNEEWKDLPTLQDVAEAQAQGCDIQIYGVVGWETWHECVWALGSKYRGRPRQPAMKKVKSLCWRFSDGDLAWRIEGMALAHPWIRVPSEDKEFEVPA